MGSAGGYPGGEGRDAVHEVGVGADDRSGLLDLPEALNRLSPEFRAVVLMFYGEGASYREIADALELPQGTVMSRLARARSALRDWLEPETRVVTNT